MKLLGRGYVFSRREYLHHEVSAAQNMSDTLITALGHWREENDSENGTPKVYDVHSAVYCSNDVEMIILLNCIMYIIVYNNANNDPVFGDRISWTLNWIL